jgi:hypothetical protein
MTAKQQIDLAKALLSIVEQDCALPDGSISFTSVQQDAKLAEDVAATFEAAGVAMPPHVDQVLAGAVSFVTMLGLK